MENGLLSIFYPIFQNLCHFIQLSKITPFFYSNFFCFGGGGKLPPFPPAGAPAYVIDRGISNLKHSIQRFMACYFLAHYHQQSSRNTDFWRVCLIQGKSRSILAIFKKIPDCPENINKIKSINLFPLVRRRIEFSLAPIVSRTNKYYIS